MNQAGTFRSPKVAVPLKAGARALADLFREPFRSPKVAAPLKA